MTVFRFPDGKRLTDDEATGTHSRPDPIRVMADAIMEAMRRHPSGSRPARPPDDADRRDTPYE